MTWLFSFLLLASFAEKKHQEAVPAVLGEIKVPETYTLLKNDESSFSSYLSHFPLKKKNTVLLFNGQEKHNQEANYAVIDMEIGDRDLQQCADAIMRLRSEWLFKQKKYSAIMFHFVNGQEFAYEKYAKGYRPAFKNNRFEWKKSAEENYSYPVFRNYLDVLFSYAGTASLIKELKKIPVESIQAGDVFIQSGKPYGHAVMVVAVAVNEKGSRKFLLAQSYMPAQEIHVLNNFNSEDGPWYDAREGMLFTPEWTFHSADLHRFP